MGCFKCGATKDKAILFDVISSKGIRHICNDCYKNENLPIVEKHDFRERNAEKHLTVHERLVAASGIDNVRQKTFEENKEILKQNLKLKDVVNTNFKKTLDKITPREDLIPNFHWVVMRARRMKHITQGKMAEIIAEPELSIKMLEEGIVGKDSDVLIQKIERYLDINLFNCPAMKIEEPVPSGEITEFAIDDVKNQDLVIADLKEEGSEKKSPFWKSWGRKDKSEEVIDVNDLDVEPYSEEKDLEKSQLSEKEIDEILFGK